jgi:hypothetical protein
MPYNAVARVLTHLSGRFHSSSVSRVSRKSSGSEQGGNMSRSFSVGFCLSVLACLLAVVGLGVQPAWGQAGSQGSINVTVLDPDGKVVPGATLALQDRSTNDVRNAVTSGDGNYTFVNLSLGSYKLTVSRKDFQSQSFTDITVHATQVTDVTVNLKVGLQSETVEVRENETPLVESTSSVISSTIDVKQLEDLPLSGRDTSQLSFLAPGFTGLPGNGNGTWNGLPVIAQGNNVDGVISSTSRMKFSGNQQPAIQARLEDIQEMTVQTDQLDVNQGYGATNMQVNFTTRRGTNAYHGRVFENFQNDDLNANSWANNASGLPRNQFQKNDFGGSVGGPILKDKLFFFASFATSRQPGGYTQTNSVLTSATQGGLFTFTGTDNAVHSVQLLGTPTSVAAMNGLTNSVNSVVTGELTKINGVLSLGKLTNISNDLSVQQLNWQVASPITEYFPTFRIDYNMSQSLRFNLALNETKSTQPGALAPVFPGSPYTGTAGANDVTAYTAAFGFDWTIRPTLVNQFRGGFLYNWTDNGVGATAPVAGQPNLNVNWDLSNLSSAYNGNMSGDIIQQPTSTYYPLFNMSDSLTWQHAAHTFNFGFSWYREQDHYWNAPAGIALTNLALVNGDPALNPMANALSAANATAFEQSEGEQLYAILTGDVGASSGAAVRTAYSLNLKTKQYDQNSTAPFVLDELQKAWGLFFQDSYRIKPNFTLNYGLRWDFTGDDHDLKAAYESVGLDGVWGPSGAGNEFKPGTLTGNQNPLFVARGHQYKPWNVSPQPQIGFAWSPAFTDGFMGKLTAQGQTVVRAGFALRKYTEPYQFFWDAASDYGAFFYQNNQLVDNPTPTSAGQFKPGSQILGNPFPPYQNLTPTYTPTLPESAFTFVYPYQQVADIALGAIDPNIKQPYTESWNLSVQRPIGRNNVIEFRYIGSHSVHQWLNVFTNEVNIFENGFLPQFQQAQKNLAINTANGNSTSFANNGLPGQAATPIFDQAFAGVPAGQAYGNSTFIAMLNSGAAGGLATALAGGPGGNPTYFCNIVTTFSPCAVNGGYSGAGGTQPINYFQMNPLNTGQDVGLTTAAGYSNYNGLQIDFRQKQWHGMQFDANYTWSHTLGINSQNSWTGVFNQFSLRDLRQSYGPTPFDIHNSFHASGTYDLPFGAGKRFANEGGWKDKLVGGWSIGTILTLQSGQPFQLLGTQSAGGVPASTYNDFGDSGVVLNGVTTQQLQSSIGTYHVPGQTTVDLINPKYLAANGTANPAFITPNTNPGTFGLNPWLYGPRFFDQDFAISKMIPITERFHLTFQSELLNAYNHPNFGPTPEGLASGNPANVNINNGTFGQAGTITSPNSPGNNGAREIEFRLNLSF